MRRLIGSFFLLGALLPATASAAVRTSHSGWEWGAPSPQGQNLTAVEFAGATGYASGAFGTLLRSEDAGATWSGVKTGLTENLDHLRLLGPQTVVVGGTCALRRSDDGGKTFRRLPWTASDESCSGGIRAFDFPSTNTGILVLGNGNVLRSTDGGRTWARRTAVPGTPATSSASRVHPTDVDFTSDTTGFATTDGGDIFWTTDAGSTWRALVAEPWSVRAVTFPTPQVGYAVGDAPVVLQTLDGGQSWSELGLPGDVGSLARMSCVSAAVCVGVTPDGARLVRTLDGGDTWESLAPSTVALRDVGLPDATHVVAVGDGGATVVSGDAGGSFRPVGATLPGRFTGLQALSPTTAIAYGASGALARTTDGGDTWTENDAATSDDLADISFLTPQVGYVLDRSGQLLRTGNGGESYEILDTGTAQRPEAVRALSEKTILLVGPAGVRRSVDGRTFRANAQKAVRRAPLFDADAVGRTVVAYGPQRLLYSRDGGRTFRRMRMPNRRTRIDVLDLVSSRTAYLLDARGPLYRTTDAGRHWRELSGLGTEVAYDIAFSDARHGWAAVSEFGDDRDGWVLRTDDGGRTWEPQLIADNELAQLGLAAPSPTTGFALDSEGELFSAGNGGSAGAPSVLRISSPTRHLGRRGDAVRIDGRLVGARGGEHVVVSFRRAGSTSWLFQDVVVASSGRFTVVAKPGGAATFVAQWAGDDRRQGAGTPALRIGGPRRR